MAEGPGCNNSIKYRGLKEHLSLGKNRAVNNNVMQTFKWKSVKREVSYIFHQAGLDMGSC
jgi:hypothetical protein